MEDFINILREWDQLLLKDYTNYIKRVYIFGSLIILECSWNIRVTFHTNNAHLLNVLAKLAGNIVNCSQDIICHRDKGQIQPERQG